MPQLPHIPNEPLSVTYSTQQMQASTLTMQRFLREFTRQHLLPCPYRRPSWRPSVASSGHVSVSMDATGRPTYCSLRGY